MIAPAPPTTHHRTYTLLQCLYYTLNPFVTYAHSNSTYESSVRSIYTTALKRECVCVCEFVWSHIVSFTYSCHKRWDINIVNNMCVLHVCFAWPRNRFLIESASSDAKTRRAEICAAVRDRIVMAKTKCLVMVKTVNNGFVVIARGLRVIDGKSCMLRHIGHQR